MIKSLIIASLCFSICSCHCSKQDVTNLPLETVFDNSCYESRKTLLSFDNDIGEITRIGDFYIITMNKGKKRLQPCKLPNSFKEEGLQIMFTGEQVEINPGERRFAMPLRLFALTKYHNHQ
jgi:hypothetical protein